MIYLVAGKTKDLSNELAITTQHGAHTYSYIDGATDSTRAASHDFCLVFLFLSPPPLHLLLLPLLCPCPFRIVFCAQIEDRVKRLSRFCSLDTCSTHNASLALVANVFAMHSHTHTLSHTFSLAATSAAQFIRLVPPRIDYCAS